MDRATKSQQSQNFSDFFKVYETSTNQISRWYHVRFQSYEVKKSSKFVCRLKFLAAQFFLFIDIY